MIITHICTFVAKTGAFPLWSWSEDWHFETHRRGQSERDGVYGFIFLPWVVQFEVLETGGGGRVNLPLSMLNLCQDCKTSSQTAVDTGLTGEPKAPLGIGCWRRFLSTDILFAWQLFISQHWHGFGITHCTDSVRGERVVRRIRDRYVAERGADKAAESKLGPSGAAHTENALSHSTSTHEIMSYTRSAPR